MDGFFTYDPLTSGSKGLVFIGEKILVYRRDGNTPSYPFYIDLPGGGSELDETPFDTFQRELREEFALPIESTDVVYAVKYPSAEGGDKNTYFPVAKLPKKMESQIRLGNEGLQYSLMYLDEYLNLAEVAWPRLQERARHYLETFNQ